ncbi:MAG: asparagine synthase C-terminal domain-containing protein [Candidatus Omnitrophica bacterium]|nr:asparagine synthase C-terminal domain-containing protein [Candidatus Omnitrophota bacterium]
MTDIILELKRELVGAVQRNRADGLLLSGGLDSSILASINSNTKAITINFKSYGEDIKYSTSVAKILNMEHYQKSVDIDEAIEAIPEVIKTLKTFDPAIPNDLIVYFGLKLAKKLGIDEVMTGDGADEFFAGYSFMQDIDALDDYIKNLSHCIRFSSNELGKFLNIPILQPYLDNEVINLCVKIKKDFKIKKEGNRIWGKWILRKAFEDILPKEIIWQNKRSLEYGSGMTKIRDIISSKVFDNEFEEVTNSGNPIKFMNKEHFYYYRIYKDVVGEIPKAKQKEKECPGCGAEIKRVCPCHCSAGYCKKLR